MSLRRRNSIYDVVIHLQCRNSNLQRRNLIYDVVNVQKIIKTLTHTCHREL